MKMNIEHLWEKIRDRNLHTLVEQLGIEIKEISERGVKGTMPVDHRTKQYYGMLHGGASVAFAETLASIAACVHIDMAKEIVVGLEINANHLRGMSEGVVTGEAKPLHLGRKTQVWSIEMQNEAGKPICISRCTLAVVAKES